MENTTRCTFIHRTDRSAEAVNDSACWMRLSTGYVISWVHALLGCARSDKNCRQGRGCTDSGRFPHTQKIVRVPPEHQRRAQTRPCEGFYVASWFSGHQPSIAHWDIYSVSSSPRLLTVCRLELDAGGYDMSPIACGPDRNVT